MVGTKLVDDGAPTKLAGICSRLAVPPCGRVVTATPEGPSVEEGRSGRCAEQGRAGPGRLSSDDNRITCETDDRGRRTRTGQFAVY